MAQQVMTVAREGFSTVSVFAETIGVRAQTVLRWVRAGDLPAVRLGRTILIPEDALERLLERKEVTDAP